jgi:hypothetical protein
MTARYSHLGLVARQYLRQVHRIGRKRRRLRTFLLVTAVILAGFAAGLAGGMLSGRA